MADTQRIYEAFEQFANFGAGSNKNLSGATMDNAKFSKLCRDAKIIGKAVTSVDVDIFFKKVVTKGERRITFDQFQEACELLAAKKYPQDDQGLQKIYDLIARTAPSTSGTIPDAGGIYSKLTDTSLYTGTHKLRFDEEGNGRGLEGRDRPMNTAELSQIVSRTNGTAPKSKTGKRGVSSSMEQMSQGSEFKKPTSIGASKKNLASSKNSLTASRKNLEISKSNNMSKSGTVYDRLTDSSQYTGTHKHRFDADGKGKGLSGRDSVAIGQGTVPTYHGGNVNSLSQILRN